MRAVRKSTVVCALSVAAGELYGTCEVEYANFASQCPIGNDNMTAEDKSAMICDPGVCRELFTERVKPACEGHRTLTELFDTLELQCSPCVDSYQRLNSACFNADGDLNVTMACGLGACRTAQETVSRDCAGVLNGSNLSVPSTAGDRRLQSLRGRKFNDGVQNLAQKRRMQDSMGSQDSLNSVNHFSQDDTMDGNNSDASRDRDVNMTHEEPMTDLGASIRKFFATLDNMCSSCVQKLYSIASVCPLGGDDDAAFVFHEEHHGELCEPGPCQSLLSSLQTSCESMPDAEMHVKNVVKSVGAICSLDKCAQAAMSIPDDCSDDDGTPNMQTTCLPRCLMSANKALRNCPENAQESPIPDVSLADYKAQRKAIAASVSVCTNQNTSTTPVMTTANPGDVSTDIAVSSTTVASSSEGGRPGTVRTTTLDDSSVLSVSARIVPCMARWLGLAAVVLRFAAA